MLKDIEEFKVYVVGGHLVVHVPPGRGEELSVHLASHGIPSRVSPTAEAPFDRVEIDADHATAQAMVDEWER